IREIGLLILCILITLGSGGLGGFATATSIDGWYATINKPSFNPPNYLFGPVWTFLYFLMGFALFVIIRLPKSTRKNSMLVIFIIQLVLNVFWSFLFFKFQRIDLAVLEILVLWFFILAMIIRLVKFNKSIGLLQIPYLLWVTFAFILNFSIFYLN
ncbi:tryptophan-rich sensory protein, partial [Crocinitomicaceae bacterium]|nr:tryptophan-rich sensory protein [Crocinitomicaceae bacterium]